MSRLRIFQSLWAMESLPGEAGSWTIAQQVTAIKGAGFEGGCVEIPQYEHAKECAAALRDAGLAWVVECFPATVDDLGPIIEAVQEFGREHCDHINLQPNVRPHTVLEAIPYVLGWMEMAAEAEIPLYIETHRDRMTTDLLYTLQLVDAVPKLKLTADLSHFLVGREFRWPVSEEDHALIDRILERSWAFHGRVASREQVQVPIGFAQNERWLELFVTWWERGFRSWLRRANADETLIFTTELGPPPYAITGADGEELSDRWLEAQTIRRHVLDLWDRIERETA